ncbi:hypothetical protein GGQ87_001086 [Brevundimonas alba]|uniref:Uncharacterized protein n=1 Tax=Brevundimonas alba TaxID=74314 RepID=A0A7X5YJC2_9CAUL|nr:hypothetical protein [Brevundimonas alba]
MRIVMFVKRHWPFLLVVLELVTIAALTGFIAATPVG